jgi:hypothetical protein
LRRGASQLGEVLGYFVEDVPRDALAAKRARGERLGAAWALPMEITCRIVTERREGRTYQAIANGLMSDRIPTARASTRWFPATIKAVVTSDNAARLERPGRTGEPVCRSRTHTSGYCIHHYGSKGTLLMARIPAGGVAHLAVPPRRPPCRSPRPGPRAAGIAMAYKRIDTAQRRERRTDSAGLC